MTDILFISDLCSEKVIQEIHTRSGINPGFAIQKFNRSIVKGLEGNECKVSVLSSPPTSSCTIKFFLSHFKNEMENGIHYTYISSPNIPGVKHILVFFRMFFHILLWRTENKKNKAVICDVLKISSSIGALAACKILRIRCVGIVTDLPNLMNFDKEKLHLKSKIVCKVNNFIIHSFSHYVFLTKAMNEIVNTHNKPYVIMEGLCENSISDEQISSTKKASPKTILYAGGLFEEFGMKMLVDGFLAANLDNVKLIIYGNGPFSSELEKICQEHNTIEYRGIANNEEVIKAEIEATVLVNPRFSRGEFTKYSFPSKTIEYMSTGTPMLANRLSGIPEEYLDHFLMFSDETEDGYASSIANVFAKPDDELHKIGFQARQFVLVEKNNINQTQKIVSLLK